MSSVIRRGGAKLLRLIQRALDPGAEADRVLVYPKDVAGTSQLFAQVDDGTVYQITPPAGAVPVTCFVYRPGGVAVDNIYTTWPTLVAALGTVDGCKQVLIDDSMAAASTTAIVSDMTDTTLLGIAGLGSLLTVIEGTTLPNLRHVAQQLTIDFTGTTPPVTGFGASDDHFLVESGAVLTVSGVGPFIDNNGVGSTMFVDLVGGSITFSGGDVVHTSGIGGDTNIRCGQMSLLESDTLSSIAAAVTTITNSASGANVSEIQTNVLGTLAFFNETKARFTVTAVQVAAFIAQANDLVLCDASGGAFTVTLPAALNNRGRYVAVKKVVSTVNVVTVLPDGVDTIDGAASVALAASLDSVWLVSDGISNWSLVVLPQSTAAATGNAVLTWGNNSVAATADTRFLNPGRDSSTAPTTNIYAYRAPRAGTMRNMRVRHNSLVGSAVATISYRLRVNGVDTALVVAITPMTADGSNLVDTVAIVAGDLINLVAVKAVGIGSGAVDVVVALEFA